MAIIIKIWTTQMLPVSHGFSDRRNVNGRERIIAMLNTIKVIPCS